MTEELAEDGRCYETIEQPVWKSYLYRLQQKAPKARRIVCTNEIPLKPAHYGKEFHGCISREEADKLVSEADGCYLVRESQRSPGSYTLTMRFGGISKNFRLYYDGLHYVASAQHLEHRCSASLNYKTHTQFYFATGEKRFQTIQDLVADGLITMYIDTYAKDYVDTMMISPGKTEAKKDEGKRSGGDMKENNELAKETSDASGKDQDQKLSFGRRESVKPSAYVKKHNFKVHTFKGPHWCDSCRNFLWGLIMQGIRCQDCGFNAHKQCGEVVREDCQPDKRYVKRVFGVDLTTLVKLHNTKRPFVVEACIREVERRGLDSEGIYRISGFADDVEALKNSFDKDGDQVDLSVYEDINIISGTLKQYFRMLPIPLITFDLYSKFIDAAKLSSRKEKMEQLSKALLQLPASHYETLKFLLGHLYRVAKKKEANMMTEENLSIVFGPTLMRAPDSDTSDVLTDMKLQRLVIESLITNQDILFDS